MSAEDSLCFIPTKGSAIKKNPETQFQSVIYESYKPKPKIQREESIEQKIKPESNILDVKKSRHEIIKFGMSGFDRQKKEEAKVQLAIKLGAKPPKNKYKNYKLLLQEKAKEKDKEKLMSDFQQLGKNSVGRCTAKGKSFDRKRRKEQGILDVYGQVKVKK